VQYRMATLYEEQICTSSIHRCSHWLMILLSVKEHNYSYRKNCRMLKHILHSSAQSRSKFESDRCCAAWYVMRERNIRNLITHRLPHSLAFPLP